MEYVTDSTSSRLPAVAVLSFEGAEGSQLPHGTKRSHSNRIILNKTAQHPSAHTPSTYLPQAGGGTTQPEKDNEHYPNQSQWAAIRQLSLSDASIEDVVTWFRFARIDDVGSHTSDSASSQRSSAAVSLRSIASLPSQTSRTSLDQDSFHVFTPRYDSLRSSIASSAALGETFATSHPVSDNIPLQALKGPLSKRNQPLPLKYFCTFCKKRFARKESWKSHEAEFHDWQEEYTCKFANCQEKFHRKYRFDRHHQNQHGCKKGCSCADVCRVDLPKKVAWGCGYCGIYLGTWQHRQEHIGAVHYDEEDKDKSNWQHTFVIWGLLSQPHTVAAWRSILASNFGDSLPCCTWSSEAACELQARLEWPGWTADQLVTEAFRLLDPISIPVGLRSDTAAWTNAPAYGTPDGTDTSVVENMVDTLGKESRGPNLSTTLAHIADSRIAASANVSYSPHLGDQAFRPVSFNTTPPLPAPFHMGVYDPSVRSKTPTQQLAQRLNPRKALPKRGKVTHSEQTSDRLGSFMNLD